MEKDKKYWYGINRRWHYWQICRKTKDGTMTMSTPVGLVHTREDAAKYATQLNKAHRNKNYAEEEKILTGLRDN